MVSEAPDLIYVGAASSSAEALSAVATARPDVVLMDVDMPGDDGAETTRLLLEKHPHLCVLAWTVSDSSEDLVRMMQAGCSGYVLKDAAPSELRRAIAVALHDEIPLPRRLMPGVLKRVGLVHRPEPMLGEESLTPRELEVLSLMARGLSRKLVATELGIQVSSVDTHAKAAYRKLGASSRSQAVSHALRQGLISIQDL